MAYSVSLSQFDGPLDLLLSLIGKAKIDIQDIFISQITEQYLGYMDGLGELDMDSASEFLQMAATLIEIKSRSLLPRAPKIVDEDGLSPEEALVRQLTEYKKFKEASREMQLLEGAARDILTRLPEEFPLPPPEIELTGLTLNKLARAFARVLARIEDRAVGGEKREINRDEFTIAQCMARISSRVRAGRCRFSELFTGIYNRNEVIVMFLAALEMVKHARLRVSQDDVYGEIFLSKP